MNFRKRFHNQIAYSSGTKVSQLLKGGMCIREMPIQYAGAVTCTGPNNTNALTLRGDEWSLANTISLLGGSSDSFFSMSGTELLMYNYLAYGFYPTVTPGIGSAVANPSWDVQTKIPFWDRRLHTPLDTVLDASRYTDFRAEIDCNAVTSLNVNASAPTGVLWNFHGYETDSLSGKYATGSGDFVPCRRVRQPMPVATGANVDTPIPLQRGPRYRGMLINFSQGGIDVPFDGTLTNSTYPTNIKLTSGTTTYIDQPSKVLWQDQFDHRNISRNFDRALAVPASIATQYNPSRTGAAAGTEGRIPYIMQSNNLDLRAWFYLDFCPDGYATESIETAGTPDFQLLITTAVNGTGGASNLVVTIIPEQMFF